MKKQNATKDKLTEVQLEVGQPLVVKWIDAHNLESGWQYVKDIEFEKMEVQTLGHFIALEKDQIWLAGDYSPNDEMVNTVVAIPIGWLVSIRKIENA